MRSKVLSSIRVSGGTQGGSYHPGGEKDREARMLGTREGAYVSSDVSPQHSGDPGSMTSDL